MSKQSVKSVEESRVDEILLITTDYEPDDGGAIAAAVKTLIAKAKASPGLKYELTFIGTESNPGIQTERIKKFMSNFKLPENVSLIYFCGTGSAKTYDNQGRELPEETRVEAAQTKTQSAAILSYFKKNRDVKKTILSLSPLRDLMAIPIELFKNTLFSMYGGFNFRTLVDAHVNGCPVYWAPESFELSQWSSIPVNNKINGNAIVIAGSKAHFIYNGQPEIKGGEPHVVNGMTPFEQKSGTGSAWPVQISDKAYSRQIIKEATQGKHLPGYSGYEGQSEFDQALQNYKKAQDTLKKAEEMGTPEAVIAARQTLATAHETFAEAILKLEQYKLPLLEEIATFLDGLQDEKSNNQAHYSQSSSLIERYQKTNPSFTRDVSSTKESTKGFAKNLKEAKDPLALAQKENIRLWNENTLRSSMCAKLRGILDKYPDADTLHQATGGRLSVEDCHSQLDFIREILALFPENQSMAPETAALAVPFIYPLNTTLPGVEDRHINLIWGPVSAELELQFLFGDMTSVYKIDHPDQVESSIGKICFDALGNLHSLPDYQRTRSEPPVPTKDSATTIHEKILQRFINADFLKQPTFGGSFGEKLKNFAHFMDYVERSILSAPEARPLEEVTALPSASAASTGKPVWFNAALGIYSSAPLPSQRTAARDDSTLPASLGF